MHSRFTPSAGFCERLVIQFLRIKPSLNIDLNPFFWDCLETELINKLNFLEDEDRESAPAMSSNPFDETDDDLQTNHLNPFGDPDEEGMCNKNVVFVF